MPAKEVAQVPVLKIGTEIEVSGSPAVVSAITPTQVGIVIHNPIFPESKKEVYVDHHFIETAVSMAKE